MTSAAQRFNLNLSLVTRHRPLVTVFMKDNPHVHRLIEVHTKARRRRLVSGETLLAPRQQLQRSCAAPFDFFFALPNLLISITRARPLACVVQRLPRA